MKAFQRILAVLLCLVMSLGMISMVASAEATDATIDTNLRGSITIHKYEYNGNAKLENADGTTNSASKLPTGENGAKPLAGAGFTIYKVADLSWLNGDNTPDIATYADMESKTIKSEYATKKVQEEKFTTTTSNEVTFSELELGLYVVVETTTPDAVTDACDPFFVSVPMTKVDGSGWLYEVDVYPKNSTSVGGVMITKVGANANVKLAATFDLYKNEDGTWKKKGSYATDGGSGKMEISNLAHGEYMLVETAVEVGVETDKKQGYIVNATPIYFTVNSDNTVTYGGCTCTGVSHVNTHKNVAESDDGTALLKLTITNEAPIITKGVAINTQNLKIGDTVSYNVTFTVPTNIADLQKFTIVDNPTNLQVVLDTIEMYINNATKEVPKELYSIEKADNGFVVNFNVTDDKLNFSSIADKTIYMIYDAKILESAATDNYSTNTVTLTYQDSVDVYTKQDTTEQKFCKIDITKRKDSTSGALAAGVEFELYKKGDANAKVPVTVTGSNGAYIYAGTAQTATKLVTSGASTTDDTTDDGTLVISGLPAGTYYLKETKAPDGYNLLGDYIEITVDYDDKTEASQVVTKTIVNKQGFTLRQTGGIGTLMFIIIGGVLMAGGICLIVPNKKRAV